MKDLIRPLTKNMLLKLSACRQIELEGKQCLPDDLKNSLAALYKRGYVGLKRSTINGKELMIVFVTQAGINCLENTKYKT
jgi:hypothetical protein